MDRAEVPPRRFSPVTQTSDSDEREATHIDSVFFSGISAVIDEISPYSRKEIGNDATEIVRNCLLLFRGIDFGIRHKKLPERAHVLPSLLQQVYLHNRNDFRLQAAFMILMISVKNACYHEWFCDNDSKELINVFNEVASIFCSVLDFNTDATSCASVMSTIMLRFFPRLKMGHILVFLEVKPGYETYAIDFLTSKNIISTPGAKPRFFVVRKDNIETDSCLVSPPAKVRIRWCPLQTGWRSTSTKPPVNGVHGHRMALPMRRGSIFNGNKARERVFDILTEKNYWKYVLNIL